MADNYFVTAVLVSHDGAEWLPEVIASLFGQSRQIDRIIAVDNGSLDGSEKLLTGAGITLLKSDRESGFGDAIDLALDSVKPITDGKEELIWLLHDDCAPARHALANMLQSFNDQPMLAMVGPKICGWRDRNQLLEVGVSIAVNGSRWTGLENAELDQGQHDEAKEVLAVTTAAALIRRNIFEDLGGLDPNLAIFRDDIDLGWRLRLAGYSIKTSPEAVAFHVEAAANELRTVDVEEAFLHRPHLLDRKNAAFVLLANVSWWLLPWVFIQLIGTAAIRSIGYLLAKLPGYALDELAAVGFVILKPHDLISARKNRKPKRLLSPRIIREFIPPRGSQVRLAWDRSINAISNKYNLGKRVDDEAEPMSFSDIGVLDNNFDELDLSSQKKSVRFETLRNRPFLFGIGFILLIDLFWSRNRFGSLSGGALPIAHGGAADLLSKFAQSWHPVAMGSASPSPTWLEIIGVASALTLGNISFFIATLFFLAPPIAFIAMYRSLKRNDLSVRVSSAGGVIYALSPVLINSINQGRLGTVVIALLLPSYTSLELFKFSGQTNWRRIYATGLFAGLIGAFSPILLILWSTGLLVIFLASLTVRRKEIRANIKLVDLFKLEFDLEKRIVALSLVSLLINFPWSGTLLLHPTQILLQPGLQLSGGSALNLLFMNPGGVSGIPIWIISLFLPFLLVALFSRKYFKTGIFTTILFALTMFLSPLHISGHGSVGKFWTGDLLLLSEVLLIPVALLTFVELIPNLRGSRLGLGHFVSGFVSLLAIYSVATTAIWLSLAGGSSEVRSGSPNVIPAFITSLSETSIRPKTLVLEKSGTSTNYFITRGSDLELGDPDITVGNPTEIDNAVNELVSGTGINSSKVLGLYGIQYIFMRNPIDQSLVRTIDGIGGFSRSSSTNSGIVWKVFASLPRVSIQDASGLYTTIKSSEIGAVDQLTFPGSITLAEKYDGNWRLVVDGKQIPVTKSAIGEPIFQVESLGNLRLEHDGTKRRALVSLQILFILTFLVLALPAGRRRKEVAIK